MDVNDLKELTHQYWEDCWTTEKYITKLLPEELKSLKQPNKIGTSNPEFLVQLVGFSWDPLLISVFVYKPQKIYIILNEWYGEQEGKARGDKFKEYIRKLNEENLIDTLPKILPTPLETVKDTPVDVFKFLKKHILPHLNDDKRVIIDITGAKKSMVAGAYLFASYTNCPVSYLDFDKYNVDYGRPYGYTCKINGLKSPMELFKLREWSIVEQLYRQYAFKSALEIMKKMKKMKNTELLEPNDNKAIELLAECLQFYAIWDKGDYKESLNIYRHLKTKISSITCPTATEKLGNIWPDKNNLKDGIKSLEGSDNINNSLYLKEEELLIYAYDELEKIKRLIKYKEDYRSALLRAAGLNDFLLKARLIKSWVYDKFVIGINNKSRIRTDFDTKSKLEIDKKLLEFAGASYIIKSLRWEPSKRKRNHVLNLYVQDKEAKGHRSENGPMLEKFWGNISYGKLNIPDDIFMLRNKAIHFCLSVSKGISEVAVELAEKNLVDFKEKWTKRTAINGKYEAMSWYDLCDACGIKFLPKLRRNTNE